MTDAFSYLFKKMTESQEDTSKPLVKFVPGERVKIRFEAFEEDNIDAPPSTIYYNHLPDVEGIVTKVYAYMHGVYYTVRFKLPDEIQELEIYVYNNRTKENAPLISLDNIDDLKQSEFGDLFNIGESSEKSETATRPKPLVKFLPGERVKLRPEKIRATDRGPRAEYYSELIDVEGIVTEIDDRRPSVYKALPGIYYTVRFDFSEEEKYHWKSEVPVFVRDDVTREDAPLISLDNIEDLKQSEFGDLLTLAGPLRESKEYTVFDLHEGEPVRFDLERLKKFYKHMKIGNRSELTFPTRYLESLEKQGEWKNQGVIKKIGKNTVWAKTMVQVEFPSPVGVKTLIFYEGRSKDYDEHAKVIQPLITRSEIRDDPLFNFPEN